MKEIVTKTTINEALVRLGSPWKAIGNNKIRIVLDLGDRLLMVCSDDISAFDEIMQNAMPWKGVVLTQTSAWWFEQTGKQWPNHFISADLNEFPIEILEILEPEYEIFAGRTMLVKKAKFVFPLEFIVRWYLEGSMWRAYSETGMFLGVLLPPGMKKGDQLPEPFFNVSTKAVRGMHDVNLKETEFQALVGPEMVKLLEDIVVGFGQAVSSIATERGIYFKDGKIEIGIDENGMPIIIDEAYTSDAARPRTIDCDLDLSKEPVREHLKSIGKDKGTSEVLPDWLVKKTSERYILYCKMLTGYEHS